MQRHIKKHLKKLKREKKKQESKKPVSMNRYWPLLHCIAENKDIAFSKNSLRVNSVGRYKIKPEHWLPEFVVFKSEEYKLDFSNIKENDEVHCPKCNGLADFRLFISSTIPEFK